MWRGHITLRALWVRIMHLPRTSAFFRAALPHESRWGEIEHLLADWMELYVASKQGPNAVAWRYRRPGQKEREMSALEQRKARFNARQKTRGA